MMRKMFSGAAAATTIAFARLAQASGDSGTGGVAEMEVSGGQFALMLGGLAVVGIALWLVVRMMNK